MSSKGKCITEKETISTIRLNSLTLLALGPHFLHITGKVETFLSI